MRIFIFLLCNFIATQLYAEQHWFEKFKQSASDAELYRLLYAMPKGADLHNHLSGAGFPEWWLELALAQEARGYIYYTKVAINNCKPYGGNQFGNNPYLLYFRNILQSNYQKLSECEKSEYARLQDLTPKQKAGWLNSLKLNTAHEGREEFFQTHWQRLNDLFLNHYIQAEILVRNMQAFGAEGLNYLEIDCTPVGVKPDGSFFTREEVYQYYRQRLKQRDARDSGVTVRFHYALLRFSPTAERELEEMYAFVDAHRDMYVAIDMVGREDNDKGHPLRFLPLLRKLRAQYPDIELSIHAGEVDEPNAHIRNTLLLGANRIGHGVNLLSDPDTLLHMRHGKYLVEINLISNLLLEYVDDYSQHIFPELLRTEVPVALSTDDRGMWDSNLTDEYFVAVKEFNLSWRELKLLGNNSLQFAFVEDKVKAKLLSGFAAKFDKFEKRFVSKGLASLPTVLPKKRQFICDRYQLCDR
ncbi:MAG: adenosine deaminase [Cellvibrionaceae bacterium]|nr:adenosine deaminase [Cellvibrionaceae bacterium]